MNTRTLKVIALMTMVIDHVGHFLLPDLFFLRVIGRIAFPIFTYLFAFSYRHTSNRKNLAIRVWLGAILGQILMEISGAGEIISIFFLFGLAIVMFELMDRGLDFSVLLIAITAEYFGVDYGAYGIFVLYFFYKFRDSFKIQASSYILLTLFFTLYPFMIPNNWSYIPLILNDFFNNGWHYFVQLFSIVSLAFIFLLKKEKPKVYAYPFNVIEKFFFYIFYPTHLALLAFLGAYL